MITVINEGEVITLSRVQTANFSPKEGCHGQSITVDTSFIGGVYYLSMDIHKTRRMIMDKPGLPVKSTN